MAIIEDHHNLIQHLKAFRGELRGIENCEIFWDAAPFHWSGPALDYMHHINDGFDDLDLNDPDDQARRWDPVHDDVIPFRTRFSCFPRGSPATNLVENINQMLKAATTRIKQRRRPPILINTQEEWEAVVDEALREVNATLMQSNNLFEDKVKFAMATCLCDGNYHLALNLQRTSTTLLVDFTTWSQAHQL